MSIVDWLGLALAIGLGVYLFDALLSPEEYE
jgi:K+-transporting ATPase KdpF subunit